MICPSTARRVSLFGVLPALMCCLSLGCGGEKTYQVSGKVTFKGQPISTGKIFFVPDHSKGNKGPSGYADIKDGAYDTSAPGGAGCIGGPMTITIQAADAAAQTSKSVQGAKALFPPYSTVADMPKSDSTKDFDVPADAVKGPTPPKK